MAFNPETLYAKRIGGSSFGKDTAIYKFEKIKRAKAAFRREHPDISVLDLGVGEHDGIAPEPVRAVLKREIDKPINRGYADNGILEFQQAAARYLNSALGINLPTDERAASYIIHSIGSKDALALLPKAFVDPGDTVVMTVPGYPVFGTNTKHLEGEVIAIPLREETGFLPDLAELEEKIDEFNETSKGRVKAICLNYPNNPTGANAPQSLWNAVDCLAHEKNIVVIQDAAYSGLEFRGKRPTGILRAPGGLECGLGVYSLSKDFNMIGYRLAIVAGNSKLIAAYGNVKDHSNSGQGPFIQRAGIEALDNSGFTEQIKQKYERRLGTLVDILKRNGFDAKMPDATFFLYARAPTGTKNGEVFANAEEASQHMLLRQGISVVPWDDVGHYIRFSATFEGEDPFTLEGSEQADRKIFEELDKRLSKLGLTFD